MISTDHYIVISHVHTRLYDYVMNMAILFSLQNHPYQGLSSTERFLTPLCALILLCFKRGCLIRKRATVLLTIGVLLPKSVDISQLLVRVLDIVVKIVGVWLFTIMVKMETQSSLVWYVKTRMLVESTQNLPGMSLVRMLHELHAREQIELG